MLHKVSLVFLLLISSFMVSANKNEIPLEHFSQMPMVQSPSISPDGKHIAVILNQGEFTQVAIVKFENPSDMAVILQLGAEKYRIGDLSWVNNKRIVVDVSQPYMVNDRWVRTNHLYSASIDGSDVKELRKKSRKQSARKFWLASPNLLNTLPKDPDHILVTTVDERDGNYSSVFKVNVNTGEFTKYLPNSNRIVSWSVDRNGDVLLALGVDKDYRKSINYFYTRANHGDEWKLVKTVKDFASETFSPVLYDGEKGLITVLSDYVPKDSEMFKKERLWSFDVNKGEYITMLAEAPGNYDIVSPITRREGDTYDMVGYTYNDGFIRFVYFNKDSDKVAGQIRNLFAKRGLQASLYDWDLAKKRLIILTVSDSKPLTFYTFDSAKGSLKAWYGQYPNLAKAQLAAVEEIAFEARDGLPLKGYLTLPIGVKNPPVVVHPHGGPYGEYDSKYFNDWVQMIASRGYAVLQVNFRGSGGSGNYLHTQGYGEWGYKMQTDLIDALDWADKSGKVNGKKACMFGGSYGGYAALAAGYQTPDRFKCLISIAGISDMDLLAKNFRKRGAHEYIKNAVRSDKSDFSDISPINYVAKFKAPVLLIHGKVDRRVGYRQSENMHQALKAAGKQSTFELFEYGTHNLNEAAIKSRSMSLVEAFLKQHLK